MTCAARIEGDCLIGEVRHEPGWHTCASPTRPEVEADTEMPTRIERRRPGSWHGSAANAPAHPHQQALSRRRHLLRYDRHRTIGAGEGCTACHVLREQMDPGGQPSCPPICSDR